MPEDIATEVLFKSDMTCCRCRLPRLPVQTHHIDEDPSNNVESNIAVLCTICHDDTMLRGGFGRKFNEPLVRKYKTDWETIVRERRSSQPQGTPSSAEGSVFQDSSAAMHDMHAAIETRNHLPGEVGAPPLAKKEPQVKWPVPKLLSDDPLDEREISDNRLRHVVAQGESWQPSTSGPKQELQIGHPSYSKEFGLRSPFRSFEALVSPNGNRFKFTMKLMNMEGTLGAHKVFGEVSVTIRNDTESDGIVLGFLEGDEWYERSLPQNPRPRFEVELKVLPIQSNKLHVALLSINGKRVLTKKIPQSFTSRFGLVASGNGGPCHMSISAITVHRAAK